VPRRAEINRSMDAATAHRHLERALRTARENLGEARRLVWELRREALTAREIEVLALVSRGASNATIASELFITEATVETHLIHIFGKPGGDDGPPRWSPRSSGASFTYQGEPVDPANADLTHRARIGEPAPIMLPAAEFD
jgi:DNA-binding CsgD family transcriptional regulator